MDSDPFAEDLARKGAAPADDPFTADLAAKGAGAPPAETPTLSQGSAALHSAANSAQLGFSDELQGVGGAIGEGLYHLVGEGRLPTTKELRQAYTSTRDEERQTLADAHKYYPKTAIASEIAGGLLVPLPGAGAAGAVAKASGIGMKALAAARALAPAAVAGGAYELGSQDSGQGNIASPGEDAAAALKGAATGAAAAGALKALPVVAKKPYLWAQNKLHRGPEEIKQAILDQVATTSDGKMVRPTIKKHLAKAGEAIYDELITGPDGRTVQKAMTAKTGQEGLKVLEPVLGKLSAQRDAAYGILEQAGKSKVNVAEEYVPKILKAAQKARDSADKHLADGLEGVAEMITDEAKKTTSGRAQVAAGEPVTAELRWLRGHTTALEAAAASKIGGLNEHETAKLARHVAEEAKGIMGDVIADKVKGSPALEEVADGIKSLNRRIYANLTLKDVLTQKVEKEGIQGGPVENFVKKAGKLSSLGSGGAGAGIGFAVGGPVGAAAGTALGLAAPTVARAIDRKITTSALNSLREAAQGRSQLGASATIKQIAKESGLPEAVVRSTYLRFLIGGGEQQEARPNAR